MWEEARHGWQCSVVGSAKKRARVQHPTFPARPPPTPPPRRSPFSFPPVENMGQVAVRIEGLTHGYNGRTLFEDANLVIERGERVAIIGPNGAPPAPPAAALLRLAAGLSGRARGLQRGCRVLA